MSATQSLALPQRDPSVAVSTLVDLYMSCYAGRDSTRPTRLRWWQEKLGTLTLAQLDGDPDPIASALDALASRDALYRIGRDAASGRPMFRSKGKPLAPATINRYAAALAAVFAWSIKQRITPKGWSNPMREIGTRREDNKVVRFLTDDERERLLAACRKSEFDRLYLLVLFALVSGARRGELLSLRWSDIDLEAGSASLHRTKNGEPRTLVLTPAVVDELKRFEGEPAALVFASRRFPDQPYNYVSSWKAALAAAGIKRFRFHDLRHSCASYLTMSGATLAEVADVLGHRNLNTTRRYSHLSTQHKRALVARVLGKLK